MKKNFENGVHLGAGWMLAECCGLLDQGKDPREMLVSKAIEKMARELKITEKYFKEGETDEAANEQ